MLTALIQNSGRKVAAREADRDAKPFFCFCCRREVMLHRGGARAAHFAHKPPVTCEYGAGESETHRQCKLQIYEYLKNHPGVAKCELERDLGTVRPDISAYIGGVPVAIEVQVSSLSLTRIAFRTAEYARKGIYVLWLPLYTEGLRQELYNPKPWELWLHALYQGRVYYWLRGTEILPIHFRDYYVRVRGRTTDYHKLSRKKVPISGRAMLITEDLRLAQRAAWSDGKFCFPVCKLFMDPGPNLSSNDHLIRRGVFRPR